MGNFRKPHGSAGRRSDDRFNKKPFGRPSFGGKPDFKRSGGGNSGRMELFTATCAKCGKPCEVPFRPTGERPVYCRDCFGGNKNGAMPQQNRPQENFRPREAGPVAPLRPQVEDKRIDSIRAELALMNAKLERIVEMIGVIEMPLSTDESEIPEKVVAPKKSLAKKKTVKKK